jgi:hypothetical protein
MKNLTLLFVILCFIAPAAQAQNYYDLTGLIHRDDLLGVAGVEMLCPNCPQTSVLTDEFGNYTFEGLIEGESYTITPRKLDGVTEGVTVLDKLKIRMYIFGEPMANYTRVLAADVNASGAITTIDLVYISRVMLGVEPLFPVDSWKFLPQQKIFDGPPTDPEDASFLGIKMGDVIREDEIPIASVHPIFSLPIVEAEEAGPVSAGVYVYGFSQIDGFQMTLTWDPDALVFSGASSDVLPGFNVASYYLEAPGRLNLYFGNPFQQLTLADGQQILNLEFTAPAPVGPTPIQVDVEGMPFQVLAEGLRLVEDAVISSQLEAPLGQPGLRLTSAPNLLRAGERVTMGLESDAGVVLHTALSDMSGRRLYTADRQIPAGLSEFVIEAPLAPGIYVLHLWTPGRAVLAVKLAVVE